MCWKGPRRSQNEASWTNLTRHNRLKRSSKITGARMGYEGSLKLQLFALKTPFRPFSLLARPRRHNAAPNITHLLPHSSTPILLRAIGGRKTLKKWKKSLKSGPGPGIGVRRSSARCPPTVSRTSASKRSSGSGGREAPFCSKMAAVTFCSKSRSSGEPLGSWSSLGSSSPQDPSVSPLWSSRLSSAPWNPLLSPSPHWVPPLPPWSSLVPPTPNWSPLVSPWNALVPPVPPWDPLESPWNPLVPPFPPWDPLVPPFPPWDPLVSPWSPLVPPAPRWGPLVSPWIPLVPPWPLLVPSLCCS